MVAVTLMVLHVQVRGGTGAMEMPDATTVKQKMGTQCGEHYLESMCVCAIYSFVWMYTICDRIWENRPNRRLCQN